MQPPTYYLLPAALPVALLLMLQLCFPPLIVCTALSYLPCALSTRRLRHKPSQLQSLRSLLRRSYLTACGSWCWTRAREWMDEG